MSKFYTKSELSPISETASDRSSSTAPEIITRDEWFASIDNCAKHHTAADTAPVQDLRRALDSHAKAINANTKVLCNITAALLAIHEQPTAHANTSSDTTKSLTRPVKAPTNDGNADFTGPLTPVGTPGAIDQGIVDTIETPASVGQTVFTRYVPPSTPPRSPRPGNPATNGRDRQTSSSSSSSFINNNFPVIIRRTPKTTPTPYIPTPRSQTTSTNNDTRISTTRSTSGSSQCTPTSRNLTSTSPQPFIPKTTLIPSGSSSSNRSSINTTLVPSDLYSPLTIFEFTTFNPLIQPLDTSQKDKVHRHRDAMIRATPRDEQQRILNEIPLSHRKLCADHGADPVRLHFEFLALIKYRHEWGVCLCGTGLEGVDEVKCSLMRWLPYWRRNSGFEVMFPS